MRPNIGGVLKDYLLYCIVLRSPSCFLMSIREDLSDVINLPSAARILQRRRIRRLIVTLQHIILPVAMILSSIGMTPKTIKTAYDAVYVFLSSAGQLYLTPLPPGGLQEVLGGSRSQAQSTDYVTLSHCNERSNVEKGPKEPYLWRRRLSHHPIYRDHNPPAYDRLTDEQQSQQ
jgi:hypothetical protein